jgi:hypothetical protein
MKIQIKSVLGSVLLASFALAPVSMVLANENGDVNSTSTATTTKMIKVERKDGRGYMPPAFSSSSLNREGDWKNSSSTASSTAKHEDKNKNGNNRYGDKFKLNVASTTQSLLNIANKLGTLGDQIKAIVNGQASSTDVITSAINKEEGRGAFKTFLFGADYRNLGTVISEVSKMQANINQLDNKIAKMASSTDKTALIANVQTLKDQITTLEQYVKDNINKFSLFGWFMQRFNK